MRLYRKVKHLLLLWLVLTACALLAGCANPTPAAVVPLPTETQPPMAQAPTLTAEPSATRIPIPTLTFAATPSPTVTPSATVQTPPTLSLTPTPTSDLTSSSALPPDARMDAAQRYQTNGDYDQAIAAYQAVLDDRPTPDQARQARYHLAVCYLLNGDYAASAADWEAFVAAFAKDPLLPQAHLMAGRAYRAMADCAQAIPHFQAYLARETILGDTVNEWIGDCHAASGEWDAAIAVYRQALKASSDRSTEVGLREKVASAHLALKDNTAAVAEYDAILAVARQEPYRAKIEYLAGQALAMAGSTDAAYVRYHRAVDRYPEAEYAYLALVELVDADVAVDEFQRGLVDYYAGDAYPDAYGAAIRAFDRYLDVKPAPKADEALYRKALAQQALDQTGDALDTLETIIAEYPRSTWLASAWFEKAVTLASAGDSATAVKAYLDMAAFFPSDRLAPQAAWQAAKLREGVGQHAEAAMLYERVQADFPGYESADEALWRAGLAHYRAGARDRAVVDWQALLDKYTMSSYRLKSLYWLGKLKIKVKSPGQADYWDQLKPYPHDYYALRAQQVRSGSSLTTTRLITDAVQLPPGDPSQDEAEILKWMRGWTQVPTVTKLIDPPSSLSQRLDVRRGQVLLAVGLRKEALSAFDSARSAAWSDPVALAQLSFFFREQGLHGLAARCAARLAGLWPKGRVEDAPLSLQRLAYPLVYADLLSAEAQARSLDPLLLAALIRQESLFEPVAESYAGARGLGQVMPATGEGIAKSLEMDEFTLDDLYRPWVSIRFGAYYLGVQLKRFDDQILVALAAYNGGPGNTLHWLEPAGDDLDLFVEVIGAEQSRRYLQKVYEQYLTYETLYRSGKRGE